MSDERQKPHTAQADLAPGRLLVFLRRRPVEIATVLYLATIVYNSLVPLDFSATASEREEAAGYVLGLPVVGISIPDAASNVGFYIPLGVLLCATLVRAGWSRWLAVIPTVIFAAGLSYLMELAQLWSQVRMSTTFDCLYNIAGAMGGAVISRPLVLIAGHAARKFTDELRDRPSLVLTGLLGFALAVAALLPMDVTFSVDRLRVAVKNAHVVPFEKLHEITDLHRWEGESTAFAAYHRMLRDWWMLTLDYVTWIVLYAALALVACYYLRTHCRMGALRAALHALGLCVVYSIGSSSLQLFVISRGLDVTVPISQIGGALLGTLLQPLVLNRAPRPSKLLWPLGPEQAKPLLALGLAVVMVGIGLRETAPFRFETSTDSIASQIERVDWLPMGTYQSARFHVAVDDLVRKLLRFVVLGALVAGSRSLQGASAGTSRPWRTGAGVALAVAAMEGLQLLLPSRIPGVTDVLLAWFGAGAGVYAYQLGRLWWLETRPVPAAARLRIDYRVELGEPDDELAPRERVPEVETPDS